MKQNIIVFKLKHCLHIKVIVKAKHYVNGNGGINGKNGSVTNSYAFKICVIQILMVIVMDVDIMCKQS